MIHGNTEGIRDVVLNKLEEIYDLNIPKDMIFNFELIDIISSVSSSINREISVAVNRRGNVTAVSIGDSGTVEMPLLDVKEKRLSGIRIIHTHPNGNSRLSNVDISALIKLKLDLIAAIGLSDGKAQEASIGFCAIENELLTAEITPPLNPEEAMKMDFIDRVHETEKFMISSDLEEDESEKALLVGTGSDESMDELQELSRACGVAVLDKVLQRKGKIDTAFYVGSGKVEEISLLCQAEGANMLVFDDELSASQVRNIEEVTGVKVIDRTTLILEIFARRARSREAKIQVELAQLRYRLPRLSGLGSVLSRTGGGIGTRGPGEKKLEVDKRHIRERIYDLTRELEKVRNVREIQRIKRNDMPNVSLVGYTNVGKSTLRNKLCEIALPKENAEKEKVFEKDMLFATLDTTTRAIMLRDGRLITLTDTVGFIRKLPHDLIEAFKSTLEEVIQSDLLIHVVDASSENAKDQIDAVNAVLEELNAQSKPILLVFNKIDRISGESLDELLSEYESQDYICISAKEEVNLEDLLVKISKLLPYNMRTVKYIIPYTDQQMAAYLHRNSKITEESFEEEGTLITAVVDDEVFNKCKNFMRE